MSGNTKQQNVGITMVECLLTKEPGVNLEVLGSKYPAYISEVTRNQTYFEILLMLFDI